MKRRNEGVWRGFSPAHISLVFLPKIESSPLKSGSEGVGICLTDGVEATITPGVAGKLRYVVNGKSMTTDFVRDFLEYLKDEGLVEDLNVDVNLNIPFPLSQGYGMSAASLLSISLALLSPTIRKEKGNLVELLKIQERARAEFLSGRAGKGFSSFFRKMISATHKYEVMKRWGLGDVLGSVKGGVEIRLSAGLPPQGSIQRIEDGNFIVYTAVLGGRILTPEILIEGETMRSIKRAAEEELKSIRGRSINDVFSAGLRFAKKIEIHPPDVIEAAERLAEAGFPSSPVMIGSTVAVYVPPEIANSYFRNENLSFNSPSSIWAQREVMEALKRRFDSLLEDFHVVFSRVSGIDSMGARILLK